MNLKLSTHITKFEVLEKEPERVETERDILSSKDLEDLTLENDLMSNSVAKKRREKDFFGFRNYQDQSN